MPEYDPTNPPKPMSDDLTRAEYGHDTASEQPTRWPSSNLLPAQYAGPVPSREFDAGTARTHTAQPLPAVAPPADAPAPLKSISPPPGHTAQP